MKIHYFAPKKFYLAFFLSKYILLDLDFTGQKFSCLREAPIFFLRFSLPNFKKASFFLSKRN